MGNSRNRDALLEQICRLAEGPAGPVLKEGVREWLDQKYWAFRHAVEQKEKCLPASPFPLNEHSATFPGACAVLAVLHEKTEPFQLLRPDLRDGSYRHFAWGELCKDVEDLSPRHIRNLLGYVRAELQNRGVALPEDSTAEGDVAAEGGTAQTESPTTGPAAQDSSSPATACSHTMVRSHAVGHGLLSRISRRIKALPSITTVPTAREDGRERRELSIVSPKSRC